jgi:phage gp45-like
MNPSRRSLLGFRFGSIKATQETPTVRTAQVQLSSLELHNGAVITQHYGIASRPHPGCTALVINVGGEQSPQDVIIATNDAQYHLTLAEGEVALHDDLGQKVHLTRAGIVISGNVAHTGNWTSTGSITAGFGGADQVGLQSHTSTTSTVRPTAGT